MKKTVSCLFLAVLLTTMGATLASDSDGIRPQTGTISEALGAGGSGELTIMDASILDALALLVDRDGRPVASAYIRSGEMLTIEGIGEGLYYLYFSLGQDWQDEPMRFSRNESLYKWGAPLSFATGSPEGGLEYISRSVALSEEGKGSYWIMPVSESEFPIFR